MDCGDVAHALGKDGPEVGPFGLGGGESRVEPALLFAGAAAQLLREGQLVLELLEAGLRGEARTGSARRGFRGSCQHDGGL